MVLFSCSNRTDPIDEQQQPSDSLQPKSQKQINKEYFESYQVQLNDTLTPGGKILRYRMDSLYQVTLTWGKNDFQRSKNFGEPLEVILRHGTNANGTILLELNPAAEQNVLFLWCYQ